MKRNIFFILIAFVMSIMIPIKVNAMQINIKFMNDENIIIEVESSDTTEAVKAKIETKTGIPVENQNLVYNNKVLKEGRTLADYNITKDSTIHLLLVDNEEKIKVTFDANGGMFKDTDKYIIEDWDNTYYDNLVIPTRDGYTFKGYFTEKMDGTKLAEILNESGIDEDMTFYAQWEEKIEEENPKTYDGIISSIIIGTLSLIGLSTAIVYLKKVIK